MIVTTRHLFTVPGYSKRAGFCRRGARAWCARHGIDWRDFVRNGIEAERVEAIGDPLGLAVVKWARECAAREQEAQLRRSSEAWDRARALEGLARGQE